MQPSEVSGLDAIRGLEVDDLQFQPQGHGFVAISASHSAATMRLKTCAADSAVAARKAGKSRWLSPPARSLRQRTTMQGALNWAATWATAAPSISTACAPKRSKSRLRVVSQLMNWSPEMIVPKRIVGCLLAAP